MRAQSGVCIHLVLLGTTAPFCCGGDGSRGNPVTGSAHCALAPYWARRLGKSRLRARQLSERTGEIWCGLEGDRVLLEGKMQFTMQATLEI